MSTTDGTRPLDSRGRPLSPAATPGYHAGKTPTTKGRTFPPDPIRVEDIVALLDACKPHRAGRHAELSALRLRALIIVLWRTGLRISEALALEERDLNRRDLAVTVRRGKGGKRRLSAMDEWAWQEIEAWLAARHARLDVTATYLSGLAPVELLEPIGHRRPPMMAVPTAPRRER